MLNSGLPCWSAWSVVGSERPSGACVDARDLDECVGLRTGHREARCFSRTAAGRLCVAGYLRDLCGQTQGSVGALMAALPGALAVPPIPPHDSGIQRASISLRQVAPGELPSTAAVKRGRLRTSRPASGARAPAKGVQFAYARAGASWVICT
jgi:hypothetical protein